MQNTYESDNPMLTNVLILNLGYLGYHVIIMECINFGNFNIRKEKKMASKSILIVRAKGI